MSKLTYKSDKSYKLDWNEFRSKIKGCGISPTNQSKLYKLYQADKIKNDELDDCQKLQSYIKSTHLTLEGAAPDIIRKIVEKMTFEEVINMCMTNKYFNKVLCGDKTHDLWKKIYENTTRKKYLTPYELMVERYNKQKKQHPVLVEFLRKYTPYDEYDLKAQIKLYEHSHKLFVLINVEFDNDTMLTVDDLYEADGDQFVLLYTDLYISFGNKDHDSDNFLYYDMNYEDHVDIYDKESIKQNLIEAKTEILDAVGVLNALFSKNIQVDFFENQEDEDE